LEQVIETNKYAIMEFINDLITDAIENELW
jgi:hypothetical protein